MVELIEKKNYLNYDEFKFIIESDFPNKKAELITNKINDYIIIHKEKLYILDKNMIYNLYETNNIKVIESKLIEIITSFIQNSYFNLTTDNQDYLKNLKGFKQSINNSGVSEYFKQLYIKLTNNNIKFDSETKYELHFKNGYLDMKTKEFKQRELNKHYITQYINRDYNNSTEENRNKIMDIIKKIYSDNEDMNYILSMYARALTGDSTKEQENLFFLGTGSSGKSFMMKMTQKACDAYFTELKGDAFENGNSKQDKIFNQFSINPIIRIAWINEMTDKKINGTLFKAFCEGNVITTKLFNDGVFDVKHNSKMIITANIMPNINIDTGISRRIKAYYHKSEFVDKIEDVNEEQHKYLKDYDLIEKLDNNLLNAWIDILIEYAIKWMNKQVGATPKSFIDASTTITSANDKINDFIEARLTRTNDKNDRIGKDKLRDLFIEMYPEKHTTVQQLIGEMKDRKIEYSADFRCEGIKGCFYGIRLKTETEIKTNNKNEDNNETIIKQLKEENEKLNYDLKQQKHYTETIKQHLIKEHDEQIKQLNNIIEELKKSNTEQQPTEELKKSTIEQQPTEELKKSITKKQPIKKSNKKQQQTEELKKSNTKKQPTEKLFTDNKKTYECEELTMNNNDFNNIFGDDNDNLNLSLE